MIVRALPKLNKIPSHLNAVGYIVGQIVNFGGHSVDLEMSFLNCSRILHWDLWKFMNTFLYELWQFERVICPLLFRLPTVLHLIYHLCIFIEKISYFQNSAPPTNGFVIVIKDIRLRYPENENTLFLSRFSYDKIILDNAPSLPITDIADNLEK